MYWITELATTWNSFPADTVAKLVLSLMALYLFRSIRREDSALSEIR